ncbi:MAG: protein kinase [Gemmataceae bacterium]
MPLRYTCPEPSCRKVFRLPDTFLGRRVRCPGCSTETVADAKTTVPEESTPRTKPPGGSAGATSDEQLGRFQVKRKLGAGAFGAVFQAYDPQLDRDVALKIPHPAVLEHPRRVERFFREARAAAGLRHPNIVPVYDCGQVGERAFIASAFIQGQALEDAIHDEGMELRRAATIVRRIAEGLAYAHSQGVVHRDIKPANILLTEDDQPLIADFGLAYRADEESRLTNDGAILGTPSYMAPEQAAGQQGEAQPAADQYSLGVLLYELLTGKTPFEGPPAIVLHNAIHTRPQPPSKHRLGLPRDLETICLKAMAKRPEDRYPDCQALADDLRRWLEGEPITARRLGFLERAVRWVKEEPALAGSLGALLAALLTIGVLLTVRNSQLIHDLLVVRAEAEAARDQAEAERASAENQRQKADEVLDETQLREAADLARGGNLPGFELALARVPEARRGPDWAWLNQQARRAPEFGRVFPPAPETQTFINGTVALVSSADSRTLVGLTVHGWLVAWDYWTGTPRPLVRLAMPLPEPHQIQGMLAISADHRRVAMAIPRGVAEPTGKQEGLPPGAGTFRPDHIEVMILDGATGKSLRTWKVPGLLPTVCLSSDGKIVALAYAESGKPHRLGLWDTETGERLPGLDAEIAPLPLTAVSLAISPDGKTLAASMARTAGEIGLWSIPDGAELRVISDVGLVGQLCFSADGQRLAGVGGNSFQQTEGRFRVPVLVNQTKTMQRTKYTDQKKEVVGPDGQKRVVTTRVPVNETYTVDFLADLGKVGGTFIEPNLTLGKQIYEEVVCVAECYTVQVEKTVTMMEKREVNGKTVEVPVSKIVKVPETRTRMANKSVYKQVEVRRAAQHAGLIRAWECTSGNQSFRAEEDSPVQAIAWRPDGTRIASATTGKLPALQVCPVETESVSCARQGTVVRFWNSLSSRLVTAVDRPGMMQATCLHFSPDGLHLALGFNFNGQVAVWSAQSRALIAANAGHDGPIIDLAFSQDSKTLASGDQCSSIVHLWDGKSGTLLRRVDSGMGRFLRFTPDHLLLTSTRRHWDSLGLNEPPLGNYGLWDRETGKPGSGLTGENALNLLAIPSDASKFLMQPPQMMAPRGVPPAPVVGGKAPMPAEKKVGPALPLLDRNGKRLAALQEAPVEQFNVRWVLTENGKYAVGFVPYSQTVGVWDAEKGQRLYQREKLWNPTEMPRIPAVSPSGDRLAILSSLPKSQVLILDLPTGKELGTLEVPASIREVAFAGKDRLLGFDNDLSLRVWNLETGKVMSTIRSVLAERHAISQDGNRLAVLTGQQTEMDHYANLQMHLIDLTTGKTLATQPLQMKSIADLTFSPDSKRVAYCGSGWVAAPGDHAPMLMQTTPTEGIVEVMALEAGRQVARYTVHRGKVHRVVYRPDGKAIATGGADQIVRLWNVPEADGDLLPVAPAVPRPMPAPAMAPAPLPPVAPQPQPKPVPTPSVPSKPSVAPKASDI